MCGRCWNYLDNNAVLNVTFFIHQINLSSDQSTQDKLYYHVFLFLTMTPPILYPKGAWVVSCRYKQLSNSQYNLLLTHIKWCPNNSRGNIRRRWSILTKIGLECCHGGGCGGGSMLNVPHKHLVVETQTTIFDAFPLLYMVVHVGFILHRWYKMLGLVYGLIRKPYSFSQLLD